MSLNNGDCAGPGQGDHFADRSYVTLIRSVRISLGEATALNLVLIRTDDNLVVNHQTGDEPQVSPQFIAHRRPARHVSRCRSARRHDGGATWIPTRSLLDLISIRWFFFKLPKQQLLHGLPVSNSNNNERIALYIISTCFLFR